MKDEPRFDLIHEAWIPIGDLEGHREELGLSEALTRAHELRGIDHPSPLVTISLYRLLLALATRMFAPANRTEWAKLWKADQLDPAAIDPYLRRWQNRFDLFNRERPFYQDVDARPCESEKVRPSTPARLAHELANGNNTTLFDHTVEEMPISLDPPEAARLLVTTQTFAIGGGVSKPFNFSHAPLLGRYAALVRGKSLKETLLLNMIRYPRSSDTDDDLPVWECDNPPLPREKSGDAPLGLLDLLTWQSRKVHLVTEAGSSRSSVAGVYMTQHRKLRDGHLDEAMAAYRRDDKRGWVPIGIRPERDPWRDSHAFFAVTDATAHRAPQAMHWLAELAENGVLDPRARFSLTVFGLRNRQGKVLLWTESTLPLSVQYLNDQACYADLKRALELAEEASGHLGSAMREYARVCLVRPGEQKADKDTIRKLSEQLEVQRPYWAALAVLSDDLLASLPGRVDHRTHRLDEWRTALCRTAKRAFSQVIGNHATSARRLRAYAKAQRHLKRKLDSMQPMRQPS